MRQNHLLAILPVLLAALLLTTMPAAARESHLMSRYYADEVIVKIRPNVDPKAFAAANGLQLGRENTNKLPGQPIYRFQIADGNTPDKKAAVLAGNPAVIYAEPNAVGQVPEAVRRSSWVVGFDASMYTAQWAPERINLPKAHTVSKGAGVTVAILDTGIDLNHPAFTGRLATGYDFVSNDATPQEEGVAGDDSSSAFGHGTHVAGLVHLAAPEAQIMPLRTLRPDGSGDLWTQIVALRYAVDQGATVINLSFSFGERSKLFDDMVAQVSCSATGYAGCRSTSQSGAIVVAAAGNTGEQAREWPGASSVPGLISVAASTERDTLADFSTYGGWITLAAPGERIISTIPGGSYAAWSGTSMATPLVSGVTALVRATNPDSRADDIIRRVVGGSVVIDSTVKRRLDAAAALSIVP